MNEFKKLLSEIFKHEKPLGRLIRTDSEYYFYDTGTNKVLNCGKDIYELLKSLYSLDVDSAMDNFIEKSGAEMFENCARDILEAVESENILKLKRVTQFGLSGHFKDVRKILETTMQSLNLEVLGGCNLRCGYCIYHDHVKEKRNFNHQEMSFDVARKGIDFLKDHSSESETVNIGFYGGEPLIRFDFIRDCVEYAKRIFNKKPVLFNMTTNATLITEEIAEFLLKNGFSVMVSLDGPEDIHDDYRKDSHGKGSFERVMRGLKFLGEQYEKIKKGSISVNIVYAPPYSEEKIERISRFMEELQGLPKFSILSQYPSDGSIPLERVKPGAIDEDKSLMDWALEKYKEKFQEANTMAKPWVEMKFAKLMQRPVLNEPVDKFSLNACCITGQRKSFVTTEGVIHMCEKISSFCTPIGHVETGFDFETIQKVYIEAYVEKSLPVCSRCWGIRLCDVCYISAYNDRGELDMKRKMNHCMAALETLEKTFRDFLTIQEEMPGKLDYLKEYEIK